MQKIKYPVGSKLKNSNDAKFIIGDLSQNGVLAAMFFIDGDFHDWQTQEMLDKYYTLVSSPHWVPKIGEIYWTILTGYGEKKSGIWEDDATDRFRFKLGLVFKNFEECQQKIDEINSREI